MPLTVEGVTSFLSGQDASKGPGLVAGDGYYAGVNVTAKNGSLSPRWGFERLPLTFQEGGVYDNNGWFRSYENLFKTGKFQAAFGYVVGLERYLIIIIGGEIFALNVATNHVQAVPVKNNERLSASTRRINTSNAAGYSVVFDFPAFPIIMAGLDARRADPTKYEPPISNMGVYNQNRLFISNAGSEFTGGDPLGNLATPFAPITFEEVLLVGSPYYGQIFQLSTAHNSYPITAMGFLQVVDTSTGIGPLIVATERAIYSYGTQTPRPSWEAGQFGSVISYNSGIVGPRAHTNVNSDLFFVGNDGHLRTLSMSRDQQQSWVKVPISRELGKWITLGRREYNNLNFVTYFNNKVFFGINPYRTSAIDYYTRRSIPDYAFGALAVLELDNLTSFGAVSKPSWAGIWTGLRPVEVVTIDERCFVISKEDINHVYEINPDITYDTADDKVRDVRSKVYTREHTFEDSFSLKQLHSVDLDLSDMEGSVSVDVKYLPSHGERYVTLGEFKHEAPTVTDRMPSDEGLNGYASHSIRDLTIGAPSGVECSPVTNEYYDAFKGVQLLLEVQARNWSINSYRVKAHVSPSSVNDTSCDVHPVVEVPNDSYQEQDDWNYGGFK